MLKSYLLNKVIRDKRVKIINQNFKLKQSNLGNSKLFLLCFKRFDLKAYLILFFI